jgi:hypothetical protein
MRQNTTNDHNEKTTRYQTRKNKYMKMCQTLLVMQNPNYKQDILFSPIRGARSLKNLLSTQCQKENRCSQRMHIRAGEVAQVLECQ